MRATLVFALLMTVTVLSTPARSQNICQIVAGAVIVADDGKYLGRISNKYDSESVLNEYGTYGSKYSSESIWNEYGAYGGAYSSLSPFNQYTSSPPKLLKNGRAIAHLTVNRYLQAALSPHYLKTCEFY